MRYLTLALTFLTLTGCSRSVRVRSPNTEVPGVVSTWIKGFKSKRGRFDASFYVRNDSAHPTVIHTSDFSCSRAGVPGTIISRPFNQESRPVAFKAGQRRGFKIRCDVGGDAKGDIQIAIRAIYAADEQGQARQQVAQNVVYAVTAKGRPTRAMAVAAAPPSAAPSTPSAPPPSVATPPATPVAVAPPPPKPQVVQTPAPVGPTGPSVAPSPMARPRNPARVQPQPGWVIAIMEVEDVNKASRSMAINPELVRNLSDQLRIYVAERGIRTVDKGATDRALDEMLQAMKQESYKACYDDSCQIELGKALAASHILRSKITRFGSQCVLNAELIDLRSEVAVTAASSRGGCSPEGFLDMSEHLATSITGR